MLGLPYSTRKKAQRRMILIWNRGFEENNRVGDGDEQKQKLGFQGAAPKRAAMRGRNLGRRRQPKYQLEKPLGVVFAGLATKGCWYRRPWPFSGFLLFFQFSKGEPRSRVSLAGRLQPDLILSSDTMAAPFPYTKGRLAFLTLSS